MTKIARFLGRILPYLLILGILYFVLMVVAPAIGGFVNGQRDSSVRATVAAIVGTETPTPTTEISAALATEAAKAGMVLVTPTPTLVVQGGHAAIVPTTTPTPTVALATTVVTATQVMPTVAPKATHVPPTATPKAQPVVSCPDWGKTWAELGQEPIQVEEGCSLWISSDEAVVTINGKEFRPSDDAHGYSLVVVGPAKVGFSGVDPNHVYVQNGFAGRSQELQSDGKPVNVIFKGGELVPREVKK